MAQHLLAGLQSPSQALPALAAGAAGILLAFLFIRADPPLRRAAGQGAAVALAGFSLALLAAALGEDFLLSRNLIPLLPPLAVAIGVLLGAARFGVLGPAAAAGLAILGATLSVWTSLTPAAQRPDWEAVAEGLGETTTPRIIVAGDMGGDVFPLALYLDSTRGVPYGEEVAVREVVVVVLRPRPDYAIGPCWWGTLCGGRFPLDFGPRLLQPPELPSALRLLERGRTDRLVYRRYASDGDAPLPPSSFLHPYLIQGRSLHPAM